MFKCVKTAFSILLVIIFLPQAACSSKRGTEEATDAEAANRVSTVVSRPEITIAGNGSAAPILIDTASNDYDGIAIVAECVSNDIFLVTGAKPDVIGWRPDMSIENISVAIIAGTLDDEMITRLNLSWDITTDDWERYQIQVVEGFPGAETAIVIGGSDKRGTLYGLFHISQDLGGVSPWIYWGDAVPAARESLTFSSDDITFTSIEPSVKYRGIFINNEGHNLTPFVSYTFGSYNYLFYSNVFELIIRLRANYLWPAMWGNIFHEEGISRVDSARDTRNIEMLPEELRTNLANAHLADMFGVVMGMSHHEPMGRAGLEWQRNQQGTAAYTHPTLQNAPLNQWNYFLNRDNIYDFWDDGIQRIRPFEHSMISLGMRGESDSVLLDENGNRFTLAQDIQLLRDALNDQREILERHGATQPTALYLYNEVEDYFYGGVCPQTRENVPGFRHDDGLLDNTILVYTNDNNQYVRGLPEEDAERNHPGGLGMYYHFDYWGSPRSYVWVSTNPIQRIWDQMTMSYDYGIDTLWLVNVGDIKPHEVLISYFLDLAYDFDTWGTDNPNSTDEYIEQWVAREFGSVFSEREIADAANVIIGYTDMNGRRKPEIVFSDTFHSVNYNEAQIELANVTHIYNEAERLMGVARGTPLEDAFYQMVYYPAAASANVNMMWMYSGLNMLYLSRGSILANSYALMVEEAVERDRALSNHYANVMNGGYWRSMQPPPAHIGYTGWNMDGAATPRALRVEPVQGRLMIVDVEGTSRGFTEGEATLPNFYNIGMEAYGATISNGGFEPFEFLIETNHDWLSVTPASGTVQTSENLSVTVDWTKVSGDVSGYFTITGGGQEVTVNVNCLTIDTSGLQNNTAIMQNGVAVLQSHRYTDSGTSPDGSAWAEIEGYGARNASTMKVFPTTANYESNGPWLEYSVCVPEDGLYNITVYVGPSNPVSPESRMRFGLRVNGGDISAHATIDSGWITRQSNSWGQSVMNKGRNVTVAHELTAGVNTIRVYGMDAGVLFEKAVVSSGALQTSYFGPRETYVVGDTVTQRAVIRHQVPNEITEIELERAVLAEASSDRNTFINYAHRDNGGRITAVQGGENDAPITSGAGTGEFLNDGNRVAGNLDGDNSGMRNRWSEVGEDHVWITVTLRETVNVRRINVIGQQDLAEPLNPMEGMTAGWGGFAPFEIQYMDGGGWATLATISNNADLINFWESDEGVETDRIRLVFSSNVGQGWLRLVEIEVYGEE